MKITVLGSGTCASQLPVIPNRYPPAFLVEWAGTRMLFDCSEGVRFRLERAGVDYASIAHVAISHPHPDHYALVPYIQSVACKGIWGGGIRRDRIDIYGPHTLIDEFPGLWKMFVPDDPEWLSSIWPELAFHKMSNADSVVHVEDATLSAVRVHHAFGKCDAVAYRLVTPEGVFVYSGDTGICDDLVMLAHNADVFVCEASARIGDIVAPREYGHLTPYDAGVIAHKGGVKHLTLFHYTGLDTDDAMLEDVRRSGYRGSATIAKDFDVIAV